MSDKTTSARERTQVRRSDREVSDIEAILDIVGRAKILRLGLFDGDYPYVVPLHYGYAFDDGKLVFYAHGAREGHKLDLIAANPHACVELDCDVELESGGDVACAYGSFYASVIGRGQAEVVADEQEKVRGLELLMRNQTGRDFEISPRMAAAVAVIKVSVGEFTAKAKAKASGDSRATS